MRKKVGIITFHSAHNFGAFLQCFALQTVLQNIGYEAFVINYRNKKIDKNYKVFSFKVKSIKQLIKTSLRNILMLKKNLVKWYKFENSIKKLNLSTKYADESSLKQNPPKYDCYIAGSDQIWNCDILGNLEDSYTLNFGNNSIKRIAYAASVGDPLIISNNKQAFEEKLKIFDSISVREEKIATELKKILNQNIAVTLDPALLLEKNDWNEYIKNVPTKKIKQKYILVYQIGKSKKFVEIVNAFSEKIGYKVLHLERRASYKNKLFSAFDISPFEFVNYIENAEYVITTSFHATVFSILFNKKVWCVPMGGAGIRITDLLAKLKMEDRVIHSVEDVEKVNVTEEIDYECTHNLLDIERQKSITWLKNEIEK